MSQSIVPIGVGDGVTSAFTLPQNYKPSYPIYRYDWQGRQLLYPTLRQQYCDSVNPGGPYWDTYESGGPPTVTLNAATDPAGTSRATKIVTTTGVTSVYIFPTFGTPAQPAAGTLTEYVWLKGAVGGETLSVGCDQSGATNGLSAVTLTTAWVRYPVTFAWNDTGAIDLAIIDNVGGKTFYAAFAQIEAANAPGSFIDGSAGTFPTFTDYTLAGTTVDLAQVPATGAILDAQYPDVYDQRVASRSRRGGDAVAITPSDTFQISTTRGLFVAVGGNIAVTTAAGNTLLMVGVPSGETIPIRVNQVLATGTTATGIIGLY